MPTLITKLDEALAYVWCPQCAANGNSRSPIVRDGHIFKCSFGHQPTADQLMASDMVKFGEVFHEQPSPTDVQWKIYVNPEVRKKLEAKFPNNLMITIGTCLAALADGSVVMIMGEDAKKLRDKGIKSGKDMLATMEASEQLAKDRQELLNEAMRFRQILKQAGVE